MLSEKRKFISRMASRAYAHGKNWRQIYVDYGGLCAICHGTDGLEFHEPFGEDRYGWGMFQARVLVCRWCHDMEHPEWSVRNHLPSMLQDDVNIEVLMEGGYDNWIKNHGLIDRFGILLTR